MLEPAAWAVRALPVALAVVAALAPPTGKDALTYHRAVPQAYLAAGGIVELPENIPSYFALGAEMHGLWAMLLGGLSRHRVGEVAFGAVLFAFLPLLLATVYGWGRERALSRPEALIAAGLVATVPTAYYVAANAYVDLAQALYVTLAIHAAARWWTTLEPMRLVYLALALGFGLSVKLLAAFIVFTYHLERPHASDYIFEDHTLRKHLDAARDVGDLRERARAAGITHLLIRHDILLDPARSPVVDDRRPPAQNAAKLALLTAFLQSGRVMRADARFVLVELH